MEMNCSNDSPNENHEIGTSRSHSNSVIIPREPPEAWSLQHLFQEISEDLCEKDFENLKCRFKGKGGFGRAKLEKAKPLQMLDLLYTSGFISEDDLLYLQATLPRKVAQKVLQYAKIRGGVLHFDQPLENTVAGHRYTKLRISGTDFRRYSNTQLKELVQQVRNIALMAPAALAKKYRVLEIDVMNARSYSRTSRDTDLPSHASSDTYSLDLESQLIQSIHENQKLEADKSEMQREINTLRKKLHISRVRQREVEQQHLKQTTDNIRLQSELAEAKKEIIEMSAEIENLETYIDLASEIKIADVESSRINQREERTTTSEDETEKLTSKIKDLEMCKSKIETQIRNLESVHELTKESLCNFQNHRKWKEFGEKMHYISTMSLTVKKVYGNFSPADGPFTPAFDEVFKQTFTAKIGRLFPQCYYKPRKVNKC